MRAAQRAARRVVCVIVTHGVTITECRVESIECR